MPAPTSKPVLHVRPFIEGDRAALRALFVASRDAAFVWDAPGTHRVEDFDAATAGEIILVALLDGRAAGFASIWEPESFLHNLFVHPAFQSRGVGTALLDACAPHFRATATLKCLKLNRDALQFYRARGWTIRGDGAHDGGAYLLLGRDFGGPRSRAAARRGGIG